MQNRIKRIREHFGLSQAQFAQKINKSPGFISNLETGRSNMSEETISTICTVFDISRVWLTDGSGDMLVSVRPAVDKNTVGLRIREIRKKEKLTQAEFGDRVGYSATQIRFVETGKKKPSNEFVHKVAVTFLVSEGWLLTGVGEVEAGCIEVDDQLVNWLNEHPEVILELRKRGGLD